MSTSNEKNDKTWNGHDLDGKKKKEHWNNNDLEGKKWVDMNTKYSGATTEKSVIDQEISNETSWDNVDWDFVKEQTAKYILEKETQVISSEEKNKYEQNAMNHWDVFYKNNKDKFFKDRTYLHLEFPELNPMSLNRDQTRIYFSDKKENPQVQQSNNSNNNNNNKNNNDENEEVENREKEEKDEIVEEKDKWWKFVTELKKDECKGTVMEVGCGAGNAVFPILKINPEKYFYAFDFSPNAVKLVKSHPNYNEDRLTAFVCDIATQQLPMFIKDNSIDITLMIFVLSAISPERFDHVLSTIYKSLKPGGVVYVRDYGLYDLTQLRFLAKQGRKLDEHFYLRSDGTRTYFFTKEILQAAFEKVGFITEFSSYETRELRNRKRMISMYRVWVRGKFVKPLEETNNNNNTTTTTTSTSTQ
ncbi:methyltransferase type 12 domain-containing protein [Tieghemostelium lacteum]|uniref:tRNA N(3)-methylcytidine methyltransferase n=1 Tax=Tieghemostelium lacteum TaxID=361077 RepID=A0A151ZCA9_TIELA|nr:methyltransferase type 12 domain-containing protein [Tieghemostelium lacteum]|eukprot:KYQ91578.1 methyltransferase type 12 domain-containing protein [Tieghemostelium lacteum]